MRSSLLFALLLALLPAPARADARPVALVFVESPGETLDDAQREAARTAAVAALEWWTALSPQPLAFALAGERTITVDNPFHGSGWIQPHLTYHGEQIEIYLVANEATHRGLLDGHLSGWAAPAYRAAVATTWAVGGLDATIAHELGHVLYNLPDRYTPGLGCTETDIMCEPTTAYRQRWMGCATLAELGAACSRVWMPGVATRGESR